MFNTCFRLLVTEAPIQRPHAAGVRHERHKTHFVTAQGSVIPRLDSKPGSSIWIVKPARWALFERTSSIHQAIIKHTHQATL